MISYGDWLVSWIGAVVKIDLLSFLGELYLCVKGRVYHKVRKIFDLGQW